MGNAQNAISSSVRSAVRSERGLYGMKNVGWRFVRHGLHDSRWTGDSQHALKSGSEKPDQGFVSYSILKSEGSHRQASPSTSRPIRVSEVGWGT